MSYWADVHAWKLHFGMNKHQKQHQASWSTTCNAQSKAIVSVYLVKTVAIIIVVILVVFAIQSWNNANQKSVSMTLFLITFFFLFSRIINALFIPNGLWCVIQRERLWRWNYAFIGNEILKCFVYTTQFSDFGGGGIWLTDKDDIYDV